MNFSKGLNDWGAIEELMLLLQRKVAQVDTRDSRCLSFQATGDICLVSRALSTEFIGFATTYFLPPKCGKDVAGELKIANTKLSSIRRNAIERKGFLDLSAELFVDGLFLVEQYLWNEGNRLTLIGYAADRNFDAFLKYLRSLQERSFAARVKQLKKDVHECFGSAEVTNDPFVKKALDLQGCS